MKKGDRVIFTKGFNKGEKGKLVDIRDIGGVSWFGVKMDRTGFVRGGQFQGMLRKVV